MLDLFKNLLIAVKAGIALGMLLSQCCGSEPGIGPDGQFLSVADKTPVPIVATVSDTKVELPEVIMYTAPWCGPCKTAKPLLLEAEKQGKLPFKLKIVDDEKLAPDWVEKFPTFSWANPHNKLVPWKASGWAGVKNLVQRFELSVADPKPKAVTTSYDHIASGFHTPFIEVGLGYTSTNHLIHEHNIPKDVVLRYAGDQSALNRLHGFAHIHGK